MKYTAGQAAKATGVATATITRALKSGKISGQKDINGAWMIDPAELHRVFPLVSLKEHETPSMKQNEKPYEIDERPLESSVLQREIQMLRETLADVREIVINGEIWLNAFLLRRRLRPKLSSRTCIHAGSFGARNKRNKVSHAA